MRRRALAIPLALLVACGDLVGVSAPAGDDVGPRADGGADVDAATGDANVVTPSCRSGADFATPTAYTDFPLMALDHIWLSPDGLTIWASNDTSDTTRDDLFTSTRANTAVPFAVDAASTLSSTSDDDRPSLSPDLTTIVFARALATQLAIFSAHRADASAPFPTPTFVDLHVASGTDAQDPWLARSGRLYFSLGAPPHLYYADPTGPGTWGSPVAVPGPLTMDGEENPVLSDDELVLYFGAYESSSTDNADLWMTQRPSRDQPFAPAQRLAFSQPGTDEYPTWTTADGCTLYFSKNPDVLVTKRGP